MHLSPSSLEPSQITILSPCPLRKKLLGKRINSLGSNPCGATTNPSTIYWRSTSWDPPPFTKTALNSIKMPLTRILMSLSTSSSDAKLFWPGQMAYRNPPTITLTTVSRTQRMSSSVIIIVPLNMKRTSRKPSLESLGSMREIPTLLSFTLPQLIGGE